MLKRQEQGLQQVCTHFRKDERRRETLSHVHYTVENIYSMNAYEAYRLPNNSDQVTLVAFPDKYPSDFVDATISKAYEEADRVSAEIPAQPTHVTKDGIKVMQIGNGYFDARFVRHALKILGKDVTAYPSENSRKILLLHSDAGDGIICPFNPAVADVKAI